MHSPRCSRPSQLAAFSATPSAPPVWRVVSFTAEPTPARPGGSEPPGTNKRMLYYYFGSKDDLFRAVLRQRLADRAPTARERDRTGPGRIAELQDRLDDSADYVRLLMWEGLERLTARLDA